MVQLPILVRRIQAAGHIAGVQLSRALDRNLAGPFVVYIEVTKKCNVRCQFCDIWIAKEETKNEMSTEDLLRLTADLKELGTKAVALFGGEALLRRDLFDVIAAMKRAGLYITLDTNGYLLPQFHERIDDSGVDMLVASLDGAREPLVDSLRGLPGTFKRTVEGLRLLRARNTKMKLVINTLIVRDNFRELLDVIRLGEELGIRNFRLLAFNSIYPYNMCGQQSMNLNLHPEELPELQEKIEEVIQYCKSRDLTLNPHEFLRGIPDYYSRNHPAVNCYVGYASLNIWNNGDVGYCVGIPGGVGNIRNTPLLDIWQSKEFAQRRSETMSEPCNKCYVACHLEQNYWFNPRLLMNRAMGRA